MAHEKYQECIEACNACTAACEHCASACLGGNGIKMMARCIALDRTCADICSMAARWMARDDEFAAKLCVLCAEICETCGNECARHEVEHCKRCAEACFKCAKACRRMV